jgi:soluble lytic murein transglycosylase-like protein
MFLIPIMDVPLHCINEAAIQYHLPSKLIISILEVEQGKVGQTVKNSNGTYDIGPMQINSSWLPELKEHGITQHDIQYDGCKNIQVGAWILSKKIARRNDFLVGVGDYNSHTPQYNKKYSFQVRVKFSQISYL